jgi:protein-disulfide isomerase
MNRTGLDKIIMGFVVGGIVGFIIGYAVTYKGGKDGGDAGGGGASAAAVKAVDAKPLRELEPTPAKGGASPKVIIQEVSEFECPFCSKVTPTIKQIIDTYGDQVRVEFRHNPLSFHANAMNAALASMAANRQGKFWEMHDTLFANQKALAKENLEKYAAELGLDVEKFKADMADPAIKKKVEADQAAAVSLGATGTPAFFINGIKLSGAKSFEEFKTTIDAEIKKADAKLAGGAAADNVAYQLMSENDSKVLDVFVRNVPSAKPADPPKEVWKVAVRGDEQMKGNVKDPLVTIVEWSEFQCPFCSKIGPTVKQVLDEYGDKVRFVFKHNPLSFHDKAELASIASFAAAAQGKFWEMHDKLFENQQALDRPDLEKYAEELGLDMVKFKADVDAKIGLEQIRKDQADAADVKASGTPSIYVNGKKLEGGNSFDNFKALIDSEIEAMNKLLEKGTPKEKLYAEAIKGGKIHKALEDKVNALTPSPATLYGKPGAKITITEFSDFQCPFCSKVGGPLKELKNIYGDDVAVVFKHFPLDFHKEAFLAAEASLAAAEQGKFWEYHDLLFENQKALKRTDLELYAQQLGLDMEKFKAALDTSKYKDQVNKDMAEGRRAGVQGTPSVYINGRKYQPSGGYAVESLQKDIDKHVLGK